MPTFFVSATSTYSAALQEGLETPPAVPLPSSASKVDEMCPFALNGECM